MKHDHDRTALDFTDENRLYVCSCGAKFYGNGVNGLCPSCGAPMEGDE
jgi:rubrerythrin